MLARAQQALYYEIKPRRCAGGDNDVRSLFIEVEKPLCAFPKAERNKPRIDFAKAVYENKTAILVGESG